MREREREREGERGGEINEKVRCKKSFFFF